MTAFSNQISQWITTRKSFDVIAEQAINSHLSFKESELLQDSHWRLGQDARLREDIRFRPTPWGRWVYTNSYLANDMLFAQLQREHLSHLKLKESLNHLKKVVNCHCVFCPGDTRFVLDNENIRLSAQELTNQPLIEKEITEIEKYTTHLPIHTLKAAAASLPALEWGPTAQEQMVETIGWVKVSLAGKKLNPRMFIAQLEGHSMDDGKSGLIDRGYAVFEFWPAGTKQFLIVLVRGAFSDPETGSYAVKKYVADERDIEGRHQKITLVSLNPDKEGYPDIELDIEDDEQVTVVAKVIQALSPKDFARKPKPPRRHGRRDLSSKEAVKEISDSLAEYANNFFQAPLLKEEEKVVVAECGWSNQLICLEAEAGGLHIEAGPFTSLWSFVKRLSVKGHNSETSILASNIRQRQIRIAVSPETNSWHWVADGFEDDPDIDLTSLNVMLPQQAQAYVFRVDAEGVGRLISSHVLSLGQNYRILLPKSTYDLLEHKPEVQPTSNEWKIWELELIPAISLETQESLRQIGLQIGEVEPRLNWVLVPPVLWQTTPRGQSYPCFSVGQSPVIAINGLNIEFSGEASLFVYGSNETQTLSLPPGSSQLIQLHELVAGKYVLLLLHDRTRIPLIHLAFECIVDSTKPPSASWTLAIESEVFSSQSGSVISLQPRDLGIFDLPEKIDTFQIEAPPGWPVRVLWRQITEDLLCTICTDVDGQVDFTAILSASRERRTRHSIWDMVIDLAELGSIILRHERRSTPETIQSSISELLSSRGATVQHLAGKYKELLPIWFEPLGAILGYDIELIAIEDIPKISDEVHVSAFRLLHMERENIRIERQLVRLLFLVEDLKQHFPETLLPWIDKVCSSEGIREVLLSDGLCWAEHRRGSRIMRQVYDLSIIINDSDEFLSFLSMAAEGI